MQRYHFADKVLSSQSYGFSSSHVWMWELDHKESWAAKNWCFWTVVLETTLESPLDSKKIKPVNPAAMAKSLQSCPTLWHPMDCSTPGFPVLHHPGACSNACSLSPWCHPTISSSVIAFSSCLQSFPASGFFLMSWLMASGDRSIGASSSASVLLVNIQNWFPLGLTGLISL